FVQWYLEPAEVDSGFSIQNFGLPASEHEIGHPESGIQNAGARGAGGWAWHDPFADGALRVQDGLEIRAANGRDLRRLNSSAPRLLRPAGEGDFAVQTVCCAESEHTPAIGGILLWGSKENYLRLERGTRGPHEVSFQGRLADPASLLYPDDIIIGRGRLPAERLFLR